MLFLHDLQSPINIGLILRASEQFQVDAIVFDPRGVMRSAANIPVISDFSCGALKRRPPRMIESLPDYRTISPVRVVATCFSEGANPLRNFTFRTDDLILLGNEYDGLPQAVIDSADTAVYIPLPAADVPKTPSYSPIDPHRFAPVERNGSPSLNVAMAATIICDEMYTQRTGGFGITGSEKT